MQFGFGSPLFFVLFLLVPGLGYFYIWRKPKARIRFSNIKHLKAIPQSKAAKMRHLVPTLRIAALCCLIIALARPQYGRKSVEIISEGIDIILAIDTSGSMKALDFFLDGKRRTRLAVVKQVVADFVKKRRADRMGMVVFGENAFTQCPLTLDHGILLSFLADLEIGTAGENATAIGSAVATSVSRLKDLKSKSKIIILLTDGRNNAGKIDPKVSASLAEKYKIKIYTIGVGTRGKAPIMIDTPFGQNQVYQQVDIDEPLLEEMAANTAGKYYRATGTQELSAIYDEIDKLERTEIKVKEHVEYNELFASFLVIAFLLLVFEAILANTRFKSIP